MGLYDKALDINPGTLDIGNNSVNYVFDQSRSIGGAVGGARSATPGGFTRWKGGRLRGTVKAETNAVTVRFYLLTDNASASGDWELDTNAPGSGGSLTVAAGSTQPFDWKINGIGRADILNGATGPSDLTVMGLFWEPSMEPGA